MQEKKTKEFWIKHKETMANMRQSRRHEFWTIVKEFRRLGFTVYEIGPNKFRFNDCLDVYPSNKRYCILDEKKWGDIRGVSFRDFLKDYFKVNYKINNKKITISV